MPPDERAEQAFREAMSQLAAGVVVVTTELDGKPWGMTVSACCSVSLSPATLLVSLGGHTVSARAVAESRRFGVSVLGSGAIEVARFGAAPGTPKFLEPRHCQAAAESQTPVVAGALAHVDCEVTHSLTVADHELFVGEMRDVLLHLDGEPLVYFGRSFRLLAAATPADLLYTNW